VRALSWRSANACEYASGRVCRCRCGGRFHGAGRRDPEELPETDIHHARLRTKGAVLVNDLLGREVRTATEKVKRSLETQGAKVRYAENTLDITFEQEEESL
jgi:hypothetical protein